MLRGHVTPSHAGEVVLIEMSRGGTWQVIARPRLGHGSGYSVSHRFAKAGAVKLKVVLGRDSRNVRSTSPTVTLTVKGSKPPLTGYVRPTAYLLRRSSHPRTGAAMSLCFIEPQDAIRVIAESVGREARRQILGEVVRAWVDEIPESELESHYAKALADLDEHDLSLLAAWHASLEVGHPLPNREFLVNVFPSLGDHRREALKIAAGFRGEEAFEAGVGEDQAFDTVLPWLSEARCIELAKECLELYCWDRLGAEN